MIVWDIAHIFKVLGGSPGVRAACEEHNKDAYPPEPTTVAVWKHRDKIPAIWFPAVFFQYLRAGGSLDDAFAEADAHKVGGGAGMGWEEVGL